MERMFVVAAAVLLAAGTGVAGKGIYQGPDKESPAPPVAPSKASPPTVPPYFAPVPMDTPAEPAITIDSPADGTIYPPDLIPPQFAWRDDNPDRKSVV